MNKKYLYLFTMLFAFVAMGLVGCSDDDAAQQTDAYGYAQFKLYKSASKKNVTGRAGMLDNLSDAYKIKVVLQGNNSTMSHTLLLHSYNEENATYGLRTDKVKMLAGKYDVIGYVLYDEADAELLSADVTNTSLDVIPGGLAVANLYANTVSRGQVSFKIVKEITAQTRATEVDDSFPISDIKTVDITVQNTFTLEKITFECIKADYEDDFHNDGTPGSNRETSYVVCDSVLWLKSGNYKVLSFRAYSDKKGKKLLGEVYNVTAKTFDVADNKLTKDVEVPFYIKGTEAYIKDYIALKEIWEALDGPSWDYRGEVEPKGSNWNFNKDIDMWGDQPGVGLDSDGRVSYLSLEGFGIKGVVPAAIGNLTELTILYLGSHSEQLGGHIFPGMTKEQKLALRYDYEKIFLEKDFRTCLSPEWQKTIGLEKGEEPLKARPQIKGIQYGDLTNQLTGISKALMRCTKLEQLYVANSPITSENFFVDDIDDNHPFAEEESTWSWENFSSLLDLEIYNCPNLTSLPMDLLAGIPELQLLNIACCKGISAEQLRQDWISIINGNCGDKIQIIYMGYNNLKEFPEYDELKKMSKLSMLDCTSNQIEVLHPFGKEISFAKIYLDNNKIKEVPNIDGYFCGYSQMESFNISGNKLTKFPDIFNAKSVYVGQSIDFSNNLISEFENGENFRGINMSQVNLSRNRLEKFPSILFEKNSPMGYLVLSGNGMTEFPKGALKGEKTFLLEALDLSYNKLSKLPDDFSAQYLPYLTGIDLSYNRFDKFPTQPLSISALARYFIRYQSDENGNRCLREWPQGLWQHIGLRYFFIGGNDYRKIDDTISPDIFYFEIADNPNITINVSEVCDYIYYGYYMLIYDPTQDIRGCDILNLEK